MKPGNAPRIALDRIRSAIGRTLELLSEFLSRSSPATDELLEIRSSIHIDAPPSVVFETIADPDKSFATSSPFVDVSVVGDRSAGAGTVYRWTFDVPFGSTLAFEEVVTEWVEPERFAYRATAGWNMAAENRLEPEGAGTRLTSTFRYRLPAFWRRILPRRAIAFGVRRILRNIRRNAEAAHRSVDPDATALIEFPVSIDAPPEEVFRVVGDPRSKRVWVPAIKQVELRTEYDGPHAEYVASSGVGPIEFPFEERIIEWDPPTRLGHAGTSRWGRFRSRWRLEPRGGGTRAYYRMDFRFGSGMLGRLFGAVVAFLVRPWMSRQTARRVKAAVETGAWPFPRGTNE